MLKGKRFCLKKNHLFLFPPAFVLFLLPLVVHLHGADPGLSGFDWSTNGMYQKDLFLYWKSILLSLLLPIMLLLLVFYFKKQKNQAFPAGMRENCFEKEFLFLLGYEILAFLSSLCSEYREYSFSGVWSLYESVYVILCYGLLIVYTVFFIKKEQDLKKLFYVFAAGAFLLTMMGLFQMAGFDFYRSFLGWKLTAPSVAEKIWKTAVYDYETGRTQMSLANPNNAGMYAAMAVPVFGFFSLLLPDKKGTAGKKIFFGILSAGMLSCMIGACAKSGMAALISIFIVSVFLLRKRIFRTGKISLLLLAACILFILLAFWIKGDVILSNLRDAASSFQQTERTDKLSGIKTQKDCLLLFYGKDELRIKYEKGHFSFRDGEGIVCPYDNSRGTMIILKDSRYKGLSFQNGEVNGEDGFYIIEENGTRWGFTKEYQYYFWLTGKNGSCIYAENMLKGYEGLATGRGYIWGRSIPLLKKCGFLGTGADTFLFQFPQNDYLARIRYGYEGMLITKPHCLYLQIGIQSGIPALICFLLFYGIYIGRSFLLYWKETYQTELSVIGVSIFLGILGYLTAGLATDSSVCVSPVFYVLTGMGMAANQMLRKESKPEGKNLEDFNNKF